ncbi:fibrinogen C domain-containing protein 1-like [Branchiostoma floridae]|uniref:Fibrinogen C domain-containing protein 1-like n=2 Tax=Branchiostoma floridae TaxID=7739 RepID=A0A9J7M754_BRAFL|nr:fibrinogen C domain-containing protein 1-like [Branchiostoma floridae]
MLEKHGVDCEPLKVTGGNTAGVQWTPVSQELESADEKPEQGTVVTSDDGVDDKTNSGEVSNKHRFSVNLRSPPKTKVLRQTHVLKDCAEIFVSHSIFGHTHSGLYSIEPDHFRGPVSAYCDQTTDGGGWTVIQRRFDGSLEFFRGMQPYETGFGDASGEYWLGLGYISSITTQNPQELYIELETWDGNVTYARYSTFVGGNTLSIGGYSGTAGDAFLTAHHDQTVEPFVFRARHIAPPSPSGADGPPNAMVETYGSGWWYVPFGSLCNLNGPYFRDPADFTRENGHGVYWIRPSDGPSSAYENPFYSLKKTKMMIRPTNFGSRVLNLH